MVTEVGVEVVAGLLPAIATPPTSVNLIYRIQTAARVIPAEVRSEIITYMYHFHATVLIYRKAYMEHRTLSKIYKNIKNYSVAAKRGGEVTKGPRGHIKLNKLERERCYINEDIH